MRLISLLLSRFSPAAILALLCLPFSASAQLPSSVDIDLAPGATATTMDVRLKANGQSFNEVISGLTFTVRWVDTSPATIGQASTAAWCPAPNNAFSPGSLDGTLTPGNGFKYRTYTGIGTQQIGLSEDLFGCGPDGQTLPANTWVTVAVITVSNNSGCTEFQIVNDAFTAANNKNFFVSLNGTQGLAGAIEPTTVLRGSCTADCAGVIGGLPASMVVEYALVVPLESRRVPRLQALSAMRERHIARMRERLR
ncbi:MAG: hypothetical protein IPJ85_05245 [Flavobacteriales bacterium]|nr:hypothetical protein [Flavobacteriales bacterium]